MKRFLLIVALVMPILSALQATPSFAAEKLKLVVGGDHENPPYEFLKDGKATGFNVEVMRAVAEIIGADVEFRLGPWSEVRTALEQGKIDALAGMYYSEERSRLVDFSVFHTMVSAGLFVREGSPIRSIEDLKGKEVIAQKGDVIDDYLHRKGIASRIVEVKDPADELTLLASGRHDCALMPSRLQGEYLKRELGISGVRGMSVDLPQLRYCFAVRRGNAPLRYRLDEGLDIIKMNGRYQEIYNKWFGIYEKGRLWRTVRYFVWALAIIASLLAASSIWSWFLRREVRKRTAELRAREESLRFTQFAIDNASDQAFWMTEGGHFFYLNDAACRSLGYTREELLKLSIPDIDPTFPPEKFTDHWRNLKEKGAATFETFHRTKDGRVYPVEIRANHVDFDGREYHCSFAADISERKKAEQALRESEEKFRVLAETSPAAIFLYQGDRYVYVSPSAIRLTGYTEREFLEMNFWDFAHEDFREIIKERGLARLRGESVPSQYEIKIVAKTGEEKWLYISAGRIDYRGGPAGIVTMFDVTDRRRIEEELQHAYDDLERQVLERTAELRRANELLEEEISTRNRTERVITARLRLLELAATHSLDDLLEATIDEAEALTGSAIGFYHFLEPDQKTLSLQNWSTRTKAEFCRAEGKGLHYDLSAAGIWVDCIHERRPVIHNDYASLPHRKGLPPDHAPLIRELVLPVFRGDSIVAIIGVGNKPDDYTPEDLEAVSFLADLAWEIAERKQAEEKLHLTQFCVDKASIALYQLTRGGDIWNANEYACKSLGYSMEEFRSMTIFDIDPTASRELFNDLASKTLDHGSITFERIHRRKDGTTFPVEITVNSLEFRGRNFGLCFAKDITERKQAEEELRLSQFCIDKAGIGIYQTDENGAIFMVNEHACNSLGYSREELCSLSIFDIDPEITPEKMLELKGIIDERGSMTHYTTHRRRDGTAFPVEITANNLDFRGKLYGISFVKDITERRRAEEALRRAKEEWERTFASVPDLIAILDNRHRIVRVNEAMAKRLGLAPEDCAGLCCYEAIHGTCEPPPFCPHIQTMADGTKHVVEVHEERLGGDFLVSTVPLNDKQGAMIGSVHIAYDITERKRAEEALKESESRVRRKLESILDPEGDIGELELADIVDAPGIQALMDDLYRNTGLKMSIIDLKGRVLVDVGWQDICLKYHRDNTETRERCRESDTVMTEGVRRGWFRKYRCRNNMWHLVTPIFVGDKHMGNLFMGQFFFDNEELNYDLFRAQAREFGFPEEEYMAALEAVPRHSEDFVNNGKAFFLRLIDMFSKLSYGNIKLARLLAERDRLTEKLREANLVVENSPVVLFRWGGSDDWPVEMVSGNVLQFGYEPEEFLSGSIVYSSIIHPEDLERVTREVHDICDGGGDLLRLEYRIITKGGDVRWVNELTHVERDPAGRVKNFEGVVIDITKRKLAEEAIRESRAKYQAIVDYFEGYIYICSQDYRVEFMNKKLIERTGYDATGEFCYKMMHNRDSVCPWCFNDRVFAGETLHWEMFSPKDDRWFYVVNVPIRHSDGTMSKQSMMLDITDRKLAEEELRKANMVVENSPVVLFRCRAEPGWPVELVSKNVVQFGYTPEEFLSGELTYSSIVHPRDLEKLASETEEYAALGEEQWYQEYRIVTRDGDSRWIIDETLCERNEEGEITHYEGVIIDVTDRKMAEEKLQWQKYLLEELNATLEERVQEEVTKNREKDFIMIQQNRQAALGEILDHIAHQWKQPLNSISLITYLLKEGGVSTNDDIADVSDKILDLVENMAQTMNLFRDFYRPDKEKTLFSIEESIDRALSFIRPAMRFESIDLQVETDQGLRAFGYPKEFAQVILNLVGNAREAFSERKAKDPKVIIKGYAEDGMVVVTVSDNAGGIDEKIMDNIFDLDFTTKGTSGGTGVGLYMSKNIIESHMGGKLTAENVDEGAQFSIMLATDGSAGNA